MIGTAALATGAGFLVLLFWPLPVIRTFGLLLLAGIGFAFALSLTAGLAALSLTGGTGAGPRAAGAALGSAGERFAAIGSAGAAIGARLRGARQGARSAPR